MVMTDERVGSPSPRWFRASLRWYRFKVALRAWARAIFAKPTSASSAAVIGSYAPTVDSTPPPVNEPAPSQPPTDAEITASRPRRTVLVGDGDPMPLAAYLTLRGVIW